MTLGDSPQPDSATPSRHVGHALETPSQRAYRAYIEHRPGCAQCQQSVFVCPTGARLWDAYKDAAKSG